MKNIKKAWDDAHAKKVAGRRASFLRVLESLPRTREDLEGLNSSQVLWTCGEWSLVLVITRVAHLLEEQVEYHLLLAIDHAKKGRYERLPFDLPAPGGWEEYVNYSYKLVL